MLVILSIGWLTSIRSRDEKIQTVFGAMCLNNKFIQTLRAIQSPTVEISQRSKLFCRQKKPLSLIFVDKLKLPF